MNDSSIVLEINGAVAWIRLNRPDSMNAINDNLLNEFNSALDAVERDDSIRVVVITGTGRAFCAGADLKWLLGENGSVDGAQILKRVRSGDRLFQRIPALGKPTIAALNGYAGAGGMSIMMACDLVIAAESTRISDAHSNYGLVSAGGGMVRLARMVGPVVAKYFAFTGNSVKASDCVKYGLVNEVVPDDQLYSSVSALAEQLARKSPRVLASMKRLIDDGLDQPMAVAAQFARQALALHVYSCSDLQEGLAAFCEKREPIFD